MVIAVIRLGHVGQIGIAAERILAHFPDGQPVALEALIDIGMDNALLAAVIDAFLADRPDLNEE